MSRGQRISTSTGRRRPGGDGASADAILTPRANDDLWLRAAKEGWRILLVDHDEADYALVRDVVAESQHIRFHLDWARTLDEALQRLAQQPYDVCLLAYSLGERTGIDLLAELEATHPLLPVIMLTSQGNQDEDLAAMRAGAMDYLVKTRLDAERLERAIRYALTQRRTEEALWESEARNRALLFAIPDMIFTFDEDGTYLDFMPAPGVEPYVKPEDFLGKTVHEVLPADKAQRTMQDIRRALETGAVQRHEYTLASGQQQRDFEYRMVPSGDDEVLAIVRDITERNQAEAAHRESEERLRLALGASQAGTFDVDVATKYCTFDDRSLEIYGLSEADRCVDAAFFYPLVHPEDLPRLRAVLKQVLASESRLSVDYRIRRPDGHERYVEASGVVLRNDQGEAVRLTGVNFDITERKQAEKAHRESEERLQLVLGASRAGTFDFDVATQYCTWDDRSLEIFGLSEADRCVDAEFFYSLVHPDEAQLLEAVHEQVLASESHYHVDYRIRRPDGEERYVQARGVILRNEQGEAVRVIGMNFDITERKQAEETLKESEQRFHSLIESTADGIIISDASGKITLWNRGAQNMFGYRADEIIGKPILELMPESFRPRHLEAIAQLEKTGVSKHVGEILKMEGLRKDGSVFPLELSLSTWQTREKRFFSAIIRDITARKRVEEALLLSQERFALAVWGSNDGMWDWPDITEDEEWWSPRWYELLGYDEGEVEASYSNFIAFLHPDDRARVQEDFQVHFEDRVPFDVEYRLRMKSGDYRWFRGRGQALWDDEGHPVRMSGSIRDITVRKRAEEELRTTQEYLDTILLNLPVGVAIFEGPEFRYYRINHRLAEMNGLSVEDHIGRPLAEVLPDAAPDIIPGLRHVLETGEARLNHEFSTRLPKDPTVIRHFIDSFFPIRGADGKPGAVGAVVVDITERKQAEVALKQSEEKFRTLAEESPNMIFINQLGRVVYANRKCEEVLGYTRQEFYAPDFHFLNLIAPESMEIVKISYGKHLKGEEVEAYEYTLITKEGKRIEEIITTRLIPYEGETAILGIVTDITERKRTEEALRLQSEIVQNMAEGVYLIRVSDGSIVFANPTFEQMFGYEAGELIGRHVSIVNAPTDKDPAETAKEIMASLLETGVWSGEVHNIKKDGTPFWCQANVTTVDHTSYGAVWVSVHIDITERKQAEAALRESEQKYRHYAERLQSLRDMDQAILAVRPPKEVAHMAVEHLLKMIPCRQASAILFDFEEDTVDRVTASPASPTVEVDHYRLRIKAPLLDDEVHLYQAAHSHFDSDADPDPADGKTHGILDVLLKAQTQTLGTLSLKTDAATTFTEEEVEIVREIAKPLAMAFQNAALFDRLETGRERLQALSRRLVEVQEAERRHLAQELHDEVGQLLTGLLFVLRASARVPESAVREHLKEAETITQQVLGQVRELSLDLRPAMLNKLGLVPTLLWHFDRYTKQTDIEVDFRHLGCEQRLDAQVEIVAYRVVQEALTNVARHARTAQVTVRLMANQQRLFVEIEDQGEGFDLKKVMATKTSTGLSSMQERVGLLSGVLRIETSPERGTHILAELPLTVPTMHQDGGAS